MYHLWRNEMYRLGDNAQKSYVVHRRLTDEFDNEKAQTIFGCVVLSFSSVKKQWVVPIISSI